MTQLEPHASTRLHEKLLYLLHDMSMFGCEAGATQRAVGFSFTPSSGGAAAGGGGLAPHGVGVVGGLGVLRATKILPTLAGA